MFVITKIVAGALCLSRTGSAWVRVSAYPSSKVRQSILRPRRALTLAQNCSRLTSSYPFEQAHLIDLDRDLVDQIFDFQLRDFSAHAIALHGKPSSTSAQQQWALAAVRRPVANPDRFARVWAHVKAYDGAYEMRP